jgi:hypothetical protein
MIAAPAALAQSTPHIYWTNDVLGTIEQANIKGTNVNPKFIDAAVTEDLAIEGPHIYWTDFGGPPARPRSAPPTSTAATSTSISSATCSSRKASRCPATSRGR